MARGGRCSAIAARARASPHARGVGGTALSRLFAFGVLSATGGFLDIGDLVTDAQVGARFGLALSWVTVLSAIGIVCFVDMAGRIAMRTQRPPMSVARSRLGALRPGRHDIRAAVAQVIADQEARTVH